MEKQKSKADPDADFNHSEKAEVNLDSVEAREGVFTVSTHHKPWHSGLLFYSTERERCSCLPSNGHSESGAVSHCPLRHRLEAGQCRSDYWFKRSYLPGVSPENSKFHCLVSSRLGASDEAWNMPSMSKNMRF